MAVKVTLTNIERATAAWGEDMPAWVQRIFDKYFTETYVQELLRLQAEAQEHSR